MPSLDDPVANDIATLTSAVGLSAEVIRSLAEYRFVQQRDINTSININSTDTSTRNITYTVSDESSPTRALTITDLPEVNFNINDMEFVYNRFESDESVSRNNPRVTVDQDKKIISTFDAESQFNLRSRYTAPPRYIRFKFSNNVSNEFTLGYGSSTAEKFPLTCRGLFTRANLQQKAREIVRNVKPDQILVEGGLYSYYYSGTELIDTGLDRKYLRFVENSAKINQMINSDKRQVKKTRQLIEESREQGLLEDKDLYSEILKAMNQVEINEVSQSQSLLNEIRSLSHSLAFSNLCFDRIIKASLDSRTSLYEDELRAYKQKSGQIYSAVAASIQAETMTGADFETQIGSTHLYDYEVLDDLISARSGEDENGIVAGVGHIGYMIERVEVINDEVRFLDPIIRGLDFTEFIDVDVAYGATYIYKIRNLFIVEYDCISDSEQFLRASFVIASQGKIGIKTCLENDAPKPPQSLKFKYDHKQRGLLINWEFPPNPQGDIKYFQVFKRNSISEPFTLIKYYDFDDSIVRNLSSENPSQNEYVRLFKNGSTYVYTHCLDDEFDKKSDAIYAVGCSDAHGLVSNLSAQFRVRYNKNKRKVEPELVCTSGCPRPYPNLFLNADTFQDAIKVSNKNRMVVYFTPEAYKTYKEGETPKKIIATSVDPNTPSYKFNFINTDLQKGKILNINIRDISTSNDSLGTPYLEPNNLSFSLINNE